MKQRFSIKEVVPIRAKRLVLRVNFRGGPGVMLLFRTEEDDTPQRVETSGLVPIGICEAEAIFIQHVTGQKPDIAVAWYEY